MPKKLYVGNLPFNTTEDDLRQLFAEHGEVTSVALVSDRETGRSRGFGFVEMESSAADTARGALDGQNFGGRTLRVDEARDNRPQRPQRPRGGGGGGGGGGRDRDRDRY